MLPSAFLDKKIPNNLTNEIDELLNYNTHYVTDFKKENYASLSTNVIERTELSEAFFSTNNVDLLQKLIKQRIYKLSNGELILAVNQKPEMLYVVMRALFLQTKKTGYSKIDLQKCNEAVLNEVVPKMMTEIKQNVEYLKDIDRPFTTIDRPCYTSSNRQTLPSITSKFY